MNFGEKLRQLRKQKEWTQPHLAEAIGIEQSYLSKLENGKSIPSADVFQLIQKVFEIEIEDLLQDLDQGVVHRQLRQIPEVANFLSTKQAVSSQAQTRWLITSALALVSGIVLMVSSYFALLFPDTQYNYLSKGIVLSGESKEIFSHYQQRHYKTGEEFRAANQKMTERLNEKYLLLSGYRGDIFNVPVDGGSRTYELRGVKTDNRIENRFLMVFGLFAFLLGGAGFLLEKRLRS